MANNNQTVFSSNYSNNLAAPKLNGSNSKLSSPEQQQAAADLQILLQDPTNVTKLAQYVPQIFEQGLWARTDKSNIWTRCWLAYYMSKQVKVSSTGKAKQFQTLSWIYEAIETASTELVDALLPNREDFFELQPQDSNSADQEFNAKILNKFIKFKLKQGGFLTEYPKFIKQLLLLGNSVGRVYLQTKEKSKIIRNRNLAGIEQITKTVERINIPRFECLDMFDFVVYPLNTGSLERTNCVQRIVLPLSEIQKNKYDAQTNPFGYINVEKVKPNPGLTNNGSSGVGTNRGNKQSINNAAGIQDTVYALSDFNQVEVLEYWGTIQIKDQVFEDVIVTVANRDTLLRVQFNPFGATKPFVFTSYTPIPNQIYSIGIAEQVLSTWQQATTIQNLILENLKLQTNGVYTLKTDQEPLLKPSSINFGPGSIIKVQDHDSLRLLPNQGGDIASAMNQLQWLKQQFELTTAVSDIVRGGVPRSGGTTAKEIEVRAGAAKKQFVETANHINSTSLEPIITLIYNFMIYYASINEIAAVTGEEVEKLSTLFSIPLDDYNVNITGINSYLIRNTAIDNLMNWTKTVLPTPAAKRINWTNFAKISAKLFNTSDTDSLLLPDDVMERIEEIETLPLVQMPPVQGEEILDNEET